MGQANAVHTTRRALFGAAVALPAIAATAALAAPADEWDGWKLRLSPANMDQPVLIPSEEQRWEAFGKGLAWSHPEGAQVARVAKAAGMKVGDCSTIILWMAHPSPGALPALLFHMPDGAFRCFRPRGEDL
jgi:hypothetical protein